MAVGIQIPFSNFICLVNLAVAFLYITSECKSQSTNVALNKTVTMSGTEFFNNVWWNGNFAVDGNTQTLPANCKCCSTTNRTYPGWLRVDLSERYMIGRIVVLGRSDNGPNGDFSSVEIYLGNNTERTEELKYPWSTTTPTYTSVINLTLSQPTIVQYVTLLKTFEDVMVICELQVFKQVCATGRFGNTCSEQCSDGCQNNTCNHENGYCLNACKTGKHGLECSENCSSNCHGNECEQENGNCTKGCIAGKFGRTCSQDCSTKCNNRTCDQATGYCTDGCVAGYKGPYCTQECRNNTYGENCASVCGNCKENEQCDTRNGECPNGCSAGHEGRLCTSECDNGKHGPNCESFCGECANDSCSKVNGSCGDGCIKGWTGSLCTVEIVVDDDGGSGSVVGPAVGGGVAAAVIVIIIVVVIVVMKRRRTGKHDRGHHTTLEKTNGNETDETADEAAEAINSEYANWTLEPAVGIVIHEFYDSILKKMANNKECFAAEFDSLKRGLTESHEVAIRPENRSKNRYKGMIAYDETRVHLIDRPEGQSDYINANYINGYEKVTKFIASQGPTDDMIDDFWQMVWQEKSNTIVMLTNLVEMGKVKCIQYWPDEGSIVFRDVVVTLAKTRSLGDYTIRTLHVQKNDETPRYVHQFHFLVWPDKDVPDSAWSLVKFWKAVMAQDSGKTTPYIVHCSAGVGRTGTFIALDCLNFQAAKEGCVDVFSCVETLRRQRVNMVQTKDQYIYLHEVLAETLNFGTLPQLSSQYREWYQHMLEVDERAHRSRLEIQHEHLLQSQGEYENEGSRASGWNRDTRKLTTHVIKNSSGGRVFIVTDSPQNDTVGAFWKLIKDNNVKSVIMLTDKESPYYETSVDLGTTNKEAALPFLVNTRSPEEYKSFKVQNFEYRATTKKENVSLKQFEFSHWDSVDTPPDAKSLATFLEHVRNWQTQQTESSPILLHSNGHYLRCSIICLLLSEMHRIQMDGTVNILHSAKTMKSTDGQLTIMPNYMQYKLCHDVILEHLTEADVYQNVPR